MFYKPINYLLTIQMHEICGFFRGIFVNTACWAYINKSLHIFYELCRTRYDIINFYNNKCFDIAV